MRGCSGRGGKARPRPAAAGGKLIDTAIVIAPYGGTSPTSIKFNTSIVGPLHLFVVGVLGSGVASCNTISPNTILLQMVLGILSRALAVHMAESM